MGDLQTVGIRHGKAWPWGGSLSSRPRSARMGDLQTVGIGHGKAWRQAWPWGGSLLRGVASGVGISFKAWPWGGSLVGGGEVLWLYRSEKKKKKKFLC
jgi:hypothetical protein